MSECMYDGTSDVFKKQGPDQVMRLSRLISFILLLYYIDLRENIIHHHSYLFATQRIVNRALSIRF